MNKEQYMNFIKLNENTPNYIVSAFIEKDKQIENYKSILTELEEHCEVMLKIFEKMSEEQKQEQLDKYVIYDKFLGKIQELKEKYK